MMPEIVKRNRKLINEEDVFQQNAWDDTEWTSEMLDEANRRLQEQKEASVELGGTRADVVEPQVNQKWDEFYQAHGDRFFKDRQWIFSEFPEILAHLDPTSPCCNILEVGCGVGNAVAHIMSSNQNPGLHVYCCDISSNAIETLKGREFYRKDGDAKITAFQADICRDFHDKILNHVQPASMDFITIIFTLSALKPELMESTVANLASLLKPGGMILFRDYSRYDLTQLRFKAKSYIKDNYYVRADGTTSYFFTKQFVDELFTSAGLCQVELKDDNRLLVNRRKALKMCRCWIQAKYKKMDKSCTEDPS